jgi:tRNA(fMet)-specific endonuclease VapC
MLDLVAAATIVLVPVTVLGELEVAFELGTRSAENRVALAEFLGEPFVSVLEVTSSVARRYGELFAQLKRAGPPIPTNDVWIAATTIDCGGRLLTFDRDFLRMPTLSCLMLEQSDHG